MSIGHIVKAGYIVQFAGDSCDINSGENGCIIGHIPVGVKGYLESKVFAVTDKAISAEPVNILTRQQGHISVQRYLHPYPTGFDTGITVMSLTIFHIICNSCKYTKTTRKPKFKERAAQQG
jgi:hypothetical protein